MNRWKTIIALRAAVHGAPYAILMVVGCLWLYEHRLVISFVCAAGSVSLVCWLLLKWLQARPIDYSPTPPPIKTWPAAAEKAWAEVDLLAARAEANPPLLADADKWLALIREVFDAAAKPFHPRADEPALEATATEFLKVAELVSRDLRIYLEEQAPGADRISIRNVRRVVEWGPRATRVAARLHYVYRLLRLGLNPASAVVNEAQSLVIGGVASNLGADLLPLAAGHCVRKTGMYAIQLYSGQIALDDPRFAELGADKPLRIVVLGQTKAGKSSLINALFGENLAPTDVLPCTGAVTPYMLERGSFKAIVFDTIGFAGADEKSGRGKLGEELQRCDLVIGVASATRAAREADRKLLDDARLRLAERARRAIPPIVVALSHVDSLRPWKEWNPPYDLSRGDSEKIRNIREAVAAVAADLQLAPERVVPVCLRPGAVYNVTEGLLPLLVRVLPEGERARLLRLLMESRDAEQWEIFRRQLFNAGLTVVQIGGQLAARILHPTKRRPDDSLASPRADGEQPERTGKPAP